MLSRSLHEYVSELFTDVRISTRCGVVYAPMSNGRLQIGHVHPECCSYLCSLWIRITIPHELSMTCKHDVEQQGVRTRRLLCRAFLCLSLLITLFCLISQISSCFPLAALKLVNSLLLVATLINSDVDTFDFITAVPKALGIWSQNLRVGYITKYQGISVIFYAHR